MERRRGEPGKPAGQVSAEELRLTLLARKGKRKRQRLGFAVPSAV